jgi:glycosyltransferase involved in cell wall biosynthesis
MSSPLISVVTVVFNGARDLQACIDSVADQAYGHVEHVVVDGGSTDGTVEQLAADGRTRWISEPDEGIYDAMNKGTDLARGDWVIILGVDDRLTGLTPELVARLRDPRCIYYGDVWLRHAGHTFDGPTHRIKLAHTNICQQAILYPRLAFEKYAFHLRYRLLADHEFNMRCWADPVLRFEYVDVVLADFNDTGATGMQRDDRFQAERDDLVARYFPELAPAYRVLAAVSPRVARAADRIGMKARLKRAMRRWW